MKTTMIAAAAACALSVTALPASATNYIDGYFVPWAEADFGPGDADGDGFGLKGAFQVGSSVFLTGEYESVDYDDINTDIDQLRLGAELGPGAGLGTGIYGRGEYVSLDDDEDDQDGFAGHVGYGFPVNKQIRLHGQIGYLLLDDVDGPELSFGGTYQFTSNLAAFGDYRSSYLDVDGGGDLDLSEFRIGARFLF